MDKLAIKKWALELAEFFIKQYEFDERAEKLWWLHVGAELKKSQSKKKVKGAIKKAKENQEVWQYIKSCLEK